MSLLLLLTDKIMSNKLLTIFCVQKMEHTGNYMSLRLGSTCTNRMKFSGGVFVCCSENVTFTLWKIYYYYVLVDS